jgi:hypothetical protein
MTALVAVMNKQAVALAADSAGTVQLPGREHHKIYAMNKVFALSKTEPVGVMLCGEGQFLGLPWEGVLKEYRRAKVGRTFAQLADWKEDLVAHLRSLAIKIPVKVRDDFFIKRYKTILGDQIRRIMHNGVSVGGLEQDLGDNLNELMVNLSAQPNAIELPSSYFASFLARHAEVLAQQENEVFAENGLQVLELQELRLALLPILISRQLPRPWGASQLVIAGFGSEDPFPSVVSIHVDGAGGDSLRSWDGAGSKVTFELGAAIAPYSQAEVVWSTIQGIHPEIKQRLDAVLESALTTDLPKLLAELLVPVVSDEAQRQSIVDKITSVGQSVRDSIMKQVKDFSLLRQTGPLLASIQHLGKGELAQLAESLITTTSLKYRMAIDAQESVGGPVDVAVVSREEGFIWIRRKHYFDIALNPSFRDQQADL